MLTTIKVYAYFAVKIYKKNPPKFSNKGGEGYTQCVGPGSTFV